MEEGKCQFGVSSRTEKDTAEFRLPGSSGSHTASHKARFAPFTGLSLTPVFHAMYTFRWMMPISPELGMLLTLLTTSRDGACKISLDNPFQWFVLLGHFFLQAVSLRIVMVDKTSLKLQ